MKQSSKWFWITIILILIPILYLNILYPIFSDDWIYSFVYGKESSGARVSNLFDVFISQYNHYFEWGGRIVVHSIAQLLLWIGNPWADIINAIAFVVFIYNLYYLVCFKEKYNYLILLLITFSIILFQPAFVETCLWITGSANYLWGMIFAVLLIKPCVRYYYDGTNTKDSALHSSIYFVLGLFAGCTHENTMVALIVLFGILILDLKIEKKPIPRWFWFGVSGMILGAIILVASPGNYVRLDIVTEGEETYSMINRVEFVLDNLINSILYRFIYFDIVYIIALIIYITMVKPEKVLKKKCLRLSVYYFIVAHAVLLTMTIAPAFPDRSWFVIIIFILLAIFTLLGNLEFRSIISNVAYLIGVSILSLLFIIDFYWKAETLCEANIMWKNRIEYMEIEKAKGNRNIVFPFERGFHKKYFLDELSADPSSKVNISFSRYYEIDSVRVNYSPPKN